ncbi:MAG: DNA gyrase subunit A, partial [Dehalococcoidales bacterium]|nr:DNA gyrase subunit A [Dehalococcoidales bacterium]
LALVDGQPRVLSLRELLQHHIDFRREVITRRSRYELAQAKERAHILEGLRIALDHIDEVIRTIRESETAEAARKNLMSRFGLSQVQAQAILDMQLRRLASLERQKIQEEYEEVIKTIAYLEELLGNPARVLALIKEEVSHLKSRYGDGRRTAVQEQGKFDFTEEDLIPHERVVVTLSARGFIKRVSARNYVLQHRGGKGIIGQVTREEDAVARLSVADTHDDLYFFTDRGKVYHLKCHEIPAGVTRTSKGIAIINLISLAEGERITAMIATTGLMPGTYMVMVTRLGEVKKTAVDQFIAVRSSGLIAMDLAEGDELVSVCLATDQDEVIVVTRKGQSIRFGVGSLRAASRMSGGVRAIKLTPDDAVISVDKVIPGAYLLVVSEGGYGKITPLDRYPRQQRAGVGVRTFKIVEKTGVVSAARVVTETQQIMLITAEGMVTRIPVRDKDPKHGISIQGRATQGVRVMTLEPGDRLVAITAFEEEGQ